ncbi:MAG: hypothetical protein LAT51_12685 [Flavobacteriaceae bacterium]|nr:hypothetical protein [Flavobacteriaceae bacterium]
MNFYTNNKRLYIKLVLILGLVWSFSSCEDDDLRRDNPNLLNLRFDVTLNKSLPAYNQLNFPGNAIYYPGVANKGLLVINTGAGILAFDAADPNIVPRDCSLLQINGLVGTSSCEIPNSYSLVDGLPMEDGLQYPLYNYRVQETGNIIRIFN